MRLDSEAAVGDYLAGVLALLGAGAFAVGRRRAESGSTDVESRSLDEGDDDVLVLEQNENGVWK